MKILPVEAELFHADGWTDREADRHTWRRQSECGEIPASGYASTLAQSCHLSCLFATSLRIIASPLKKLVPELNDQPTYSRFWQFC